MRRIRRHEKHSSDQHVRVRSGVRGRLRCTLQNHAPAMSWQVRCLHPSRSPNVSQLSTMLAYGASPTYMGVPEIARTDLCAELCSMFNDLGMPGCALLRWRCEDRPLSHIWVQHGRPVSHRFGRVALQRCRAEHAAQARCAIVGMRVRCGPGPRHRPFLGRSLDSNNHATVLA